MILRRKRILGKTLFLILSAVAATLAISFSVRSALGMEVDWLNWVEGVTIPFLVGAPVGIYIFTQAEKLRSAHQRLERTHVNMCAAHDRLVYMATHDQMTGLLNREAFLRAAQSCRTRGGGNFLLIVDADHFKCINDHHGHSGGDEALVKIATALRYAVRESDIVGRIGGEEFAVLLVSVNRDEAERMAEFIWRQVRFIPWKGGANAPGLSVSIGGAPFDRRHVKVSEAMREADRCLYEAKRLGRDRVMFDYSEAMAA
jgi:diguanylate cyclase (GGDEF)-like protein